MARPQSPGSSVETKSTISADQRPRREQGRCSATGQKTEGNLTRLSRRLGRGTSRMMNTKEVPLWCTSPLVKTKKLPWDSVHSTSTQWIPAPTRSNVRMALFNTNASRQLFLSAFEGQGYTFSIANLFPVRKSADIWVRQATPFAERQIGRLLSPSGRLHTSLSCPVLTNWKGCSCSCCRPQRCTCVSRGQVVWPPCVTFQGGLGVHENAELPRLLLARMRTRSRRRIRRPSFCHGPAPKPHCGFQHHHDATPVDGLRETFLLHLPHLGLCAPWCYRRDTSCGSCPRDDLFGLFGPF